MLNRRRDTVFAEGFTSAAPDVRRSRLSEELQMTRKDALRDVAIIFLVYAKNLKSCILFKA